MGRLFLNSIDLWQDIDMDNDDTFNWNEYANKQVDIANQAVESSKNFTEMKIKQSKEFVRVESYKKPEIDDTCRVMVGDIAVAYSNSRNLADVSAAAIRNAISDARTQALSDVRARMKYINEHYLSPTHGRNELYNRMLNELDRAIQADKRKNA